MTKQINLEEEAGMGIPREKLIKAGAVPINFVDYLILDGKIYEPTKWKKEEKDGQVIMTATHYRQRNMPLPQEELNRK